MTLPFRFLGRYAEIPMSEEIAQQLKQAREARSERLTEPCESSGISLAILQGLEAARFDAVERLQRGLPHDRWLLGLRVTEQQRAAARAIHVAEQR